MVKSHPPVQNHEVEDLGSDGSSENNMKEE
jgi:hypothetical protein